MNNKSGMKKMLQKKFCYGNFFVMKRKEKEEKNSDEKNSDEKSWR